MNNIRFLRRSEIDLDKWDDTIAKATHSLPYAFSWYLDAVAEHWDALVMDDYKAVMPLVWTRKFGVKCLYQPYYCQQLGVFSPRVLSADQQKALLGMAAERFYYININLNPTAAEVEVDFKLKRKRNLLLDLHAEYKQLRKKYGGNHLRNIGKAGRAGVIFSEETSLKKFQEFYLANLDRKKENFKRKHERILKALTHALIERKTAMIFTALDSDKQILAAALIIFHHNRIVNIINCSSDLGKKTGASHFLFDNIIRKYSSTSNILDFEGSSIPGVARFYEGFGAVEEVFYNYKKVPLKLS